MFYPHHPSQIKGEIHLRTTTVVLPLTNFCCSALNHAANSVVRLFWGFFSTHQGTTLATMQKLDGHKLVKTRK